MIKVGSTVILEDFVQIVDDTLSRLEKEGHIKSPLHRAVLWFESMAIVLWFFRFEDLFSEPLQRLTLDEVHQQFFTGLKKNGGSRELVKSACDKLNERYKTYDALFANAETFVGISTHFVRYVSDDAGTELDATEMMIPLELTEKATLKFDEIREVMKI